MVTGIMMIPMKKLLLLTIMTPLLMVSNVEADGNVDCPKVYKPKKKKRPAPPKKITENPATSCWICAREDAPPGPPGPPGRPGRDGIDGRPGKDATAGSLAIAGGVMYAVHAPHCDWAWGPALQLRSTDAKGLQLAVALGLASGADGSVGDENGWLGQLSVTKFGSNAVNDRTAGFGLGLHVTDINGSADNGQVDGRYIGLDAHITLQRKIGAGLDIRVEAGPVLSYLRDDVEGKQIALGIQSSLFLGGNL